MGISKAALSATLAGLALGWGSVVGAQQPAPPAPAFAPSNTGAAGARAMAANCAACHGTEGRPAQGSAVAGLAGMPRDWIVQSMTQFKEGKKPATVMHQIAKGYSDAEIAAMGDYFSKLPR
jgi:cytochrome c553